MGWFEKGYEGLQKVSEARAGGGGTRRFWIKEGSAEKKVVFLSAEPFNFYEHQLKLGGNWRNFETCIKQIEDRGCPLDATDYGPYYVGAFTVVDRSEWKDRDGKVHKNTKSLLMAKPEMLRKLKLKAKKYGENDSLFGCEFDVSRSSRKAPNIGDEWDFVKRWKTPAKMTEIFGDITEIDYEKIFLPKSFDELNTMAGKVDGHPDKVASVVASGSDEDEVDFN